ncbi:MAG: CAP-Gly domain-containing protein [archaeon]|nr:CAP-Gly domain-containing protein [archaeon]
MAAVEGEDQGIEVLSIKVGHRVRADQRIGTVRYIGEVAGVRQNTYVGVEWDEGEGRNDGRGPKGQQYFTTKRTDGKAATFFPLATLEKEQEGLAWSLNEAIHDKYTAHFKQEEIEVGQDAGSKKVEFFVGTLQNQPECIVPKSFLLLLLLLLPPLSNVCPLFSTQ